MYSGVYILFSYILLQVNCGRSGVKIINSVIAKEDEYPFIVRLERRILITFNNRILAENNVHICTCTALSRSLLLTAGHCLKSVGFIKNLTNSLAVQPVVRYGAGGSKLAKVMSVIHHPSFYDPEPKIQSNIGLVRTQLIGLNQFAKLSELDMIGVGNRVIALAGYRAIKKSVRTEMGRVYKASQLQVLRLVVMPHDNQIVSGHPMKCTPVYCLPTSTTCDGDSGGPLLHFTGVMGISTTSLEYIKGCSELNKTQSIGMGEIIALTKPHMKWINDNIKRDDQMPV
ncbi:serine protease 1-like [Spodoptera litura]|uniref:Serine protease 1-like n=1 Tax=Spodoptera litura TaxID=69820 RepID=A0A9J7EL73_SPOLT|nr:serine protease 1-like [Spodoptera litura]